MALSNESAEALRYAAKLVAEGMTPESRHRIFLNAERYIQEGKWIPTFTPEQFPKVFYPHDTVLQELLANSIKRAIQAGELRSDGGLLPLEWAAWPGLPFLPKNSPLTYWLPQWVKHEFPLPPENSKRWNLNVLTQDRAEKAIRLPAWSMGEALTYLGGLAWEGHNTLDFPPRPNAGDDAKWFHRAVVAGSLVPVGHDDNGEAAYAPKDIIRVAEEGDIGCWRTWAELLKTVGQNGGPKPSGQKKETQQDRVNAALALIEQRAKAKKKPFNRREMPGSKRDLLILLHALDPGLRSIKTTQSLNRYLKGVCAWPLDAKSRTGALPFYSDLFPDAKLPGADSKKEQDA